MHRPLLLALALVLLAATVQAFLLPTPGASASVCRRRAAALTPVGIPVLRAGGGDDVDAGGAPKKRRRKVPLPAELLEEQQKAAEAETPAAPSAPTPAPAAPAARSREDELAERLKQDIARFKAVEQAEAKPSEEEASGLAGLGQKAASAFEKVLVADFFVVLAFLAWFLTGVVFKSVFDDRSVLDGFNAIWTPVIQPALGILMAGTLGVGALNQIAKGKPEEGR